MGNWNSITHCISYRALKKTPWIQIRSATLTKGKYNLLINAQFENGQSILVSKIFNDKKDNLILEITNNNENLLDLASQKLAPETFIKFENYFKKNKNISDELKDLFTEILKN